MRLGTDDPCVGKSPAWAAGRRAAGLGHRTLLWNGRPCGLSRRQCPPGTRVLFPEGCPQANARESGRWGWDSPLPEPHSPHPASGRNSSSSFRACAEPEGGHGGNRLAHSVGGSLSAPQQSEGGVLLPSVRFSRFMSLALVLCTQATRLRPAPAGSPYPVLIHSVTLTATSLSLRFLTVKRGRQ